MLLKLASTWWLVCEFSAGQATADVKSVKSRQVRRLVPLIWALRSQRKPDLLSYRTAGSM